MRKLFSLLLCFVMVFSLSTTVFATEEKPIRVKLCNYMDSNGKWIKEKYVSFDVEPQIIDGRTMVPIRAVAEELGYTVNWNDSLNKVGIYKKLSEKDSDIELNYKEYNQYSRFINLLYNLEAKNRTEATKNFNSYCWYYGGQFSDRGVFTVDKSKLSPRATVLKNETSIGHILNIRNEYVKQMGANIYVTGQNHSHYIYLEVAGAGISVGYKFEDVLPQIIDGRTLLPLRAVTEMLGLDVSWDGNNRIVTISA